MHNVSRLLIGYDRYCPSVQTVEGRAIAAVADADFLLSGIYSAAKSGSKDVTLNVLERYGHLDLVVGEKARVDVFEPTLAWILARAR